MSRMRGYDEEVLLEGLRQWQQDYGRPPRLLDCEAGGRLKDGTPLAASDIYKRYFGTWNNALTRAGLPVIPGRGGHRIRQQR